MNLSLILRNIKDIPICCFILFYKFEKFKMCQFRKLPFFLVHRKLTSALSADEIFASEGNAIQFLS